MRLLTGAGRVGRLHYLGLSVLIVVVLIAGMLASLSTDEVTGQTSADPVVLLLMVLGVWMVNANVVRRLHDCGHSGWLAVLALIPIVSTGLALYLLLTAGDPRANRYGPPPGQPEGSAPAMQQDRMQSIRATAAEAYGSNAEAMAGSRSSVQ